MWTCLVWAKRPTSDNFWVPSHRFNSGTGEQKGITQTIYTDSEPPSWMPNSLMPSAKLRSANLPTFYVFGVCHAVCVCPVSHFPYMGKRVTYGCKVTIENRCLSCQWKITCDSDSVQWRMHVRCLPHKKPAESLTVVTSVLFGDWKFTCRSLDKDTACIVCQAKTLSTYIVWCHEKNKN